jgi:hypothetical protein
MKIHPDGSYPDAITDVHILESELWKLCDWLFWHGYTLPEAELMLYQAVSLGCLMHRVTLRDDWSV